MLNTGKATRHQQSLCHEPNALKYLWKSLSALQTKDTPFSCCSHPLLEHVHKLVWSICFTHTRLAWGRTRSFQIWQHPGDFSFSFTSRSPCGTYLDLLVFKGYWQLAAVLIQDWLEGTHIDTSTNLKGWHILPTRPNAPCSRTTMQLTSCRKCIKDRMALLPPQTQTPAFDCPERVLSSLWSYPKQKRGTAFILSTVLRLSSDVCSQHSTCYMRNITRHVTSQGRWLFSEMPPIKTCSSLK